MRAYTRHQHIIEFVDSDRIQVVRGRRVGRVSFDFKPDRVSFYTTTEKPYPQEIRLSGVGIDRYSDKPLMIRRNSVFLRRELPGDVKMFLKRAFPHLSFEPPARVRITRD